MSEIYNDSRPPQPYRVTGSGPQKTLLYAYSQGYGPSQDAALLDILGSGRYLIWGFIAAAISTTAHDITYLRKHTEGVDVGDGDIVLALPVGQSIMFSKPIEWPESHGMVSADGVLLTVIYEIEGSA